MAEGIADELVLEIKTKVDDSSYVSLKDDLEKNKKQGITLKPTMQEIYGANLKQSKTFLKGIIDGPEGETNAISKEKATELLAKILESERKSANSLENLLEKEEKNKEKDNAKSGDGDGEMIPPTSLWAIVTAVLGFISSSAIRGMYIDKINRELDIANIAYETGQTADSMAKLNYQAKNVGLSLDQIVHNAQNFTESLFTGQDDQKAMLFAALGINPLDQMRGIKTSEDAIRAQKTIYNQSEKALESSGFAPFIARQQAAKLSGIPLNQAFGYENLNSKRNLEQTNEIVKIRGSLGSKEDIMANYQDITSSLQKVTASIDQLLSTQNVIKNIIIGTADLKAGVVNLINSGLNPTTEAQAKQNTYAGNPGAYSGQAIFDYMYSKNHKGVSDSAQVKMGN